MTDNDALRIAVMLTQRDYNTVIEGIKMFLSGDYAEALHSEAWVPQSEQPTDPLDGSVRPRKWIKIGDQYWVQDPHKTRELHAKWTMERKVREVMEHRKRGKDIDAPFQTPVGRLSQRCPDCGFNDFWIYAISKCKKANPKGWKSRIECQNLDCLHEEYSMDDPVVIWNRQYDKKSAKPANSDASLL